MPIKNTTNRNVIANSKIKIIRIIRHIPLTIFFIFFGKYPKKYLSKKFKFYY